MENDKYLILFNALVKDCKNIMQSYNEHPECNHYQNAKYVMEQVIEDTADDENGFYSKKGVLVKWYKHLIEYKFFLDKSEYISQMFCFTESNKVKHYLSEVYPLVKVFKNLEKVE